MFGMACATPPCGTGSGATEFRNLLGAAKHRTFAIERGHWSVTPSCTAAAKPAHSAKYCGKGDLPSDQCQLRPPPRNPHIGQFMADGQNDATRNNLSKNASRPRPKACTTRLARKPSKSNATHDGKSDFVPKRSTSTTCPSAGAAR
jgi:hypothetical protein